MDEYKRLMREFSKRGYIIEKFNTGYHVIKRYEHTNGSKNWILVSDNLEGVSDSLKSNTYDDWVTRISKAKWAKINKGHKSIDKFGVYWTFSGCLNQGTGIRLVPVIVKQ